VITIATRHFDSWAYLRSRLDPGRVPWSRGCWRLTVCRALPGCYIVFGGFLVWGGADVADPRPGDRGTVISLIFRSAGRLTFMGTYLRHQGGLTSLNGGFIKPSPSPAAYRPTNVLLVQIIAGLIVVASGSDLPAAPRRQPGGAARAPITQPLG